MSETKKVFISYSSKDEKIVNSILELLKELNINYWKAPEMIPVGSNYAREIPVAIRECEVFLLLLSKSAQDSIWVEKEIDSAINYRKIIVPVNIDGVPLNELFTFYLNNVQTIPYYESASKGQEILRERLLSFLAFHGSNRPMEKQAVQSASSVKSPKHKVDVFYKNPAPIRCQYCGGELKRISVGTYECLSCKRENYDYLRRVRNYLEKNGSSSAVLIARETGVPRASVEYFLREEFLEIPKYAKERLSCSKCGAPIRTGVMCEKCKEEERGIQSGQYSKGSWHSSLGQ